VVCDGVRLILEANGFTVAAALDGESALAHPAVDSCRLVLCDLMLPEPSGLDLLRALRARRPGLPVVMITGYATAETAVQAAQAGAAGFLAKPFDEGELLSLVRHTLDPADAARKEGRS
jgi:two-component system response regulator AtoC